MGLGAQGPLMGGGRSPIGGGKGQMGEGVTPHPPSTFGNPGSSGWC